MSPIPCGHEAPKCQSSKLIQKCHCSAPTSLAFLSFYWTIPEFSDQSFGIWGIIWGKFTKCLDLSLGDTVKGAWARQSACLYFCIWTALWIERSNEYLLKENHTVNPSKINSSSRMLHFYFRFGNVLICHLRKYHGVGVQLTCPHIQPPMFHLFNNTNVFTLVN